MKFVALGVSMALCISLCGCVDPARIRAEHRAEDQTRCSEYGYREGTDAFADCMMRSDEKREYAEQQDRQRQEDRKAQAEERKVRLRELALERSGDERYPVCGATSPGAELDLDGFWYGEGCRAR